MITRKPSTVELVQVACTVLAVVGLVMLLPLGWVLLIVGVAGLVVATWVENRAQPAPIPTSPTEGD